MIEILILIILDDTVYIANFLIWTTNLEDLYMILKNVMELYLEIVGSDNIMDRICEGNLNPRRVIKSIGLTRGIHVLFQLFPLTPLSNSIINIIFFLKAGVFG